MARFPEVDFPGSVELADSIVALDSFEPMHLTAERTSDLFSVGHAVLKAAVTPYIHDDRVIEAILKGVGAYEILGSLVQPQEVLSTYKRGDVVTMCQGSESMLDTLTVFEDAYEEFASTPQLRDSMRLMAASNIDGSAELVERAVQGAAVMRKIQLELDMLAEVREEIERLNS